jgi:hypothetical protein
VKGRFVRGKEVLSYDISREQPTGPYRLHVLRPDGTELITEIAHATDLVDHVSALMKRLRAEGWELDPS